MEKIAHIVTHSGRFHADDVFAVAALRRLAPDATVSRTRDPDLLAAALADPDTVVLDVGGRFEAAALAFDHHQREFDEARPDGVPYAAFGLVWRHFGATWSAASLTSHHHDPSLATRLAARLDYELVRAIDAADTGAASWATDIAGTRLEAVTVSHLVDAFNPAEGDAADYDAAFLDAVLWAERCLERAALGALRAVHTQDIVRAADDGSPILVLERASLAWQPWVEPHHRLVLFPAAATGPHEEWRLQTVPRPDDPMAPIQPLPSTWAGLRDGELADVSGVPDALFCHRGRFMAGARSLAGALQLARLALSAAQTDAE